MRHEKNTVPLSPGPGVAGCLRSKRVRGQRWADVLAGNQLRQVGRP